MTKKLKAHCSREELKRNLEYHGFSIKRAANGYFDVFDQKGGIVFRIPGRTSNSGICYTIAAYEWGIEEGMRRKTAEIREVLHI